MNFGRGYGWTLEWMNFSGWTLGFVNTIYDTMVLFYFSRTHLSFDRCSVAWLVVVVQFDQFPSAFWMECFSCFYFAVGWTGRRHSTLLSRFADNRARYRLKRASREFNTGIAPKWKKLHIVTLEREIFFKTCLKCFKSTLQHILLTKMPKLFT